MNEGARRSGALLANCLLSALSEIEFVPEDSGAAGDPNSCCSTRQCGNKCPAKRS